MPFDRGNKFNEPERWAFLTIVANHFTDVVLEEVMFYDVCSCRLDMQHAPAKLFLTFSVKDDKTDAEWVEAVRLATEDIQAYATETITVEGCATCYPDAFGGDGWTGAPMVINTVELRIVPHDVG